MESNLFSYSDKPGRWAVPKNGQSGVVDVVREYSWAMNDSQWSRDDVPVIELREFQVTGGQLQAAAGYWLKQTIGLAQDVGGAIGSDATNNFLNGLQDDRPSPYDGLYRAIPTNFSYRLPFFNNYHTSNNQTWTAQNEALSFANAVGSATTHAKSFLNSGFGALVGGIAGEVIKSAAGPSVGMENQELWSNTNVQTYAVQFDLLNTVSPQETKKNYDLVNLLVYQNAYYRRNIMLSYPPCIYEVNIPGVRRCPVAVIENVTVMDIGAKRLYRSNTNDPLNNIIFPDAYRVELRIRELVPESRNIIEGMLIDRPVTAIATSTLAEDAAPVWNATKRTYNQASNAVGEFFGTNTQTPP